MKHGTDTSYVKCPTRCDTCRAAWRERARRRARAIAYRRWDPFVDAGVVLEHVTRLRAAGMSAKQIADAAGVAKDTVLAVVHHKRARLLRATGEALLAVTPVPIPDNRFVDTIGARRRIQALIANGWTKKAIAGHVGIDRMGVHSILTRQWVRWRIARAVTEVYDRLWDVAPPETTSIERGAASRARGMARRAGWPPPAAWDDDRIDDPAAEPSGHIPARRPRGHRSLPPADELAWLIDQGQTVPALAARYRVKDEAVTRALLRARRHTLQEAS